MAHAILFGELSGREIAEFLKATMEHDGTICVRPTPSEAEEVVYQRSLADPCYQISVEAFADGTPSKTYDGSRTEVSIQGDGRGIRALSTVMADEFGGLVQVHDSWKAVPGGHVEQLSPKARLCVAIFDVFGYVDRLPTALHNDAGLCALRSALDDYLTRGAPPEGDGNP